MAPELQIWIAAASTIPSNPKSADMWAVGATVYLLLTKRHLIDWPNEYTDYINGPENFLRRRFDLFTLSSNAVSFLEVILGSEPSIRLTASNALQDPWM